MTRGCVLMVPLRWNASASAGVYYASRLSRGIARMCRRLRRALDCASAELVQRRRPWLVLKFEAGSGSGGRGFSVHWLGEFYAHFGSHPLVSEPVACLVSDCVPTALEAASDDEGCGPEARLFVDGAHCAVMLPRGLGGEECELFFPGRVPAAVARLVRRHVRARGDVFERAACEARAVPAVHRVLENEFEWARWRACARNGSART